MDHASIQAALRKRGFLCRIFPTAEEAKAYLLTALAPGASVGIGGSMTIQELGLAEALRARGATVLWHWDPEPGGSPEAMRRQAMTTDAYVCSVNALLHDGRIIQIDGSGNRAAALCYGPAKAYLVAGKNKQVFGGLLAGIARIKREACPRNARRLNLQTPCADSGTCDEERCGRAMCRLTLVIDAPPTGHEVEVLLVDEDLGY